MYGALAGSPSEGSSAPPPSPAAAGAAIKAGGAGSLSPNPLPRGAKRGDEEAGRLLLGRVQQTGKIFHDDDDDGGRGINAGIFGRGARRQDNGRLVTAFLVVNYMIGSGILNTPQTFRDSGVAATTVLYFIACESRARGCIIYMFLYLFRTPYRI